jgi:membrane protein involved in colicin uptake
MLIIRVEIGNDSDDFVNNELLYAIISLAIMERGSGGRGQVETLKVPQAPETTQLDQEKLERARGVSRRSSNKYNQKNRQLVNQKTRERYRQHVDEERARGHAKYQIHREAILKRKKEQYKVKKEAAQAAQQAAGKSGNIPPLSPIWDRLSHALAAQQSTEKQRRTRQRNNP